MSKVFNNLPFDLMDIVNQYIFDKKKEFEEVLYELPKFNQRKYEILENKYIFKTTIRRYTTTDKGLIGIDSDMIHKYTYLKTEYINDFLYTQYIRRAYNSKLSKFEIRYMINKEFEIIYNMVKRNEILLKNKIKCKCGLIISKVNFRHHLDTENHLKSLYNKKFGKLFNILIKN